MAEGLPSTQALLMFSLFSDWASQGYQGKVRLRRHICHIVRISFKLFLQIGVNDAMITAIRASETHLHNVISISKVRPLFRSKLVHLSNVYVASNMVNMLSSLFVNNKEKMCFRHAVKFYHNPHTMI